VGWGGGGAGLDRSGSGQGQVAGCCECGDVISDAIKFGEFSEGLLASQEGLCSVEYLIRDFECWKMAKMK
jgi:hypothetical protein